LIDGACRQTADPLTSSEDLLLILSSSSPSGGPFSGIGTDVCVCARTRVCIHGCRLACMRAGVRGRAGAPRRTFTGATTLSPSLPSLSLASSLSPSRPLSLPRFLSPPLSGACLWRESAYRNSRGFCQCTCRDRGAPRRGACTRSACPRSRECPRAFNRGSPHACGGGACACACALVRICACASVRMCISLEEALSPYSCTASLHARAREHSHTGRVGGRAGTHNIRATLGTQRERKIRQLDVDKSSPPSVRHILGRPLPPIHHPIVTQQRSSGVLKFSTSDPRLAQIPSPCPDTLPKYPPLALTPCQNTLPLP